MREWLGGAAYLAFIALSAFGAALVVASLHALLDRVPAPAIRAGRRRQLRRFSACWAGLAFAWLAAVALLAVL